MNNDLIVKANALVEAGYQLTTNEQRLILSAIACIPKGEPIDPNLGYCISKGDFINLGVNSKTANREIREACDRLFNRYVTIKSEQGEFKTRWVQDITKYDRDWALHNRDLFEQLIGDFTDEEDFILATITFSRSIIPFLTELKSNFTKYMLSDVAGFSSSYSFRIYEFMMQYQSTGYIKTSIKDLRERLQLGDKYPATKDLKVRVIDIAIKEINEKSPYSVKYEFIKKGRKFVALELKFKLKEKSLRESTKDPKTIDIFDGFTDIERETIQQRIGAHIERLETKGEIVGDFHRKNIEKKAINERWGLDVLAKQQRIEQEQQEKRHREALERRKAKEEEKHTLAQEKAKRERFLELWEDLSEKERTALLDKVEKSMEMPLSSVFRECRREGIAHTSPIFFGWFYELLAI